eukprot:gnl/MRDRNA2_/MRDRNA2_127610_c0_seq1.p1 gnl/MRDRNA2_/MRDRNA2_127610_c0~~gnl/MRDRNA2_/MRDRNA2_127610_c0_seq1.p1  ORF type:complete len:195 (+),score=47.86 gnl/MRDRNA2_/MRDRNA2_127610_c0_seq1:2-586(+)
MGGMGGMGGKGMMSSGGGGAGNDLLEAAIESRIEQFILQWSLDDRSVQMLIALPHDQLKVVIENFAPPPDTMNVNAKLRKFVQGFVQNYRHSPQPPAAQQPFMGGMKRTFDDAFQGGAGNPFALSIETFVNKWGLDGKSKACLERLDQETLQMVMSGFDPPADTRNINARLASFVNSILAANGTPMSPHTMNAM